MKKLLVVMLSLFFVSCAHRLKVDNALANLNPTKGSKVKGQVKFQQVSRKKLKVTAEVSGLTPNSKHGFHIHEFGDCSSTDGKSAGGHYNPANKTHGGPEGKGRHVGDLGNLQADAKGHASYEKVFDHMVIICPHCSVLGRGVIVHKGEDDLKSQPTGNAGSRLACGVIGAK